MSQFSSKPVQKIQQTVDDITVPRSEQRKRSVYVRLLVTIFAGVFLVLAYFARNTPYFPLDLIITRTIQLNTNELFSALMQSISYIGYTPQVYLLVFVVIFSLYSIFKLRWEAIV